MKLTAEKVRETFLNCLFNDHEPMDTNVIGEGVMIRVGFHPERLKESEPIIIELLDELPDKFKKNSGGGWSFLNLCEDKHGNQWADLHQSMDELVALGNASGKLTFLMPRDKWNMLPGGMPYLVIN